MSLDLDNIKWNDDSLLPCIAQEHESNEVLMLAYMNKEALELSIQTGIAHYYSRSKRRLWKKGEQSGNVQEIKEILLDCDNDTILLKVAQKGVACHTGAKSCFFKQIKIESNIETKHDVTGFYNTLDILYHNILQRKSANKDKSYTALLFSKGDNGIAKKIIEESGELCLAMKDNDEHEIIHECADVFYHILVALAYHNIDVDRIYQELSSRMGMSGIEEKQNRRK